MKISLRECKYSCNDILSYRNDIILFFFAALFCIIANALYVGLAPEKILWLSHNALLSMKYFVQVVMWIVTDERHLSISEVIATCTFCH